MRLVVDRNAEGNCFRPEFGADMRIVPAAREIVPSPYSRSERLWFYRRPSPDVLVGVGTCSFVRERRRRDSPRIVWDEKTSGRRFVEPGGLGLSADRFLPGDEIWISLNPEERERASPNFWFNYWLHLAGCWNLAKERLYR